MRAGDLQPIPEEYGSDLNDAIFRMLNVNPEERPDAD